MCHSMLSSICLGSSLNSSKDIIKSEKRDDIKILQEYPSECLIMQFNCYLEIKWEYVRF